MCRGLRFIPIWLVVMAFSHLPLPWTHSHLGLPAEQLLGHIQQHHPDCSGHDLPRGWHVHYLIWELSETQGDIGIIEILSSQRKSADWVPFRFLVAPIETYTSFSNLGSVGINPSGKLLIALPKYELFKKYGSFLI
jgi:hypothetical protein